MLDNYRRDHNGIVQQVNYTKIAYDPAYVGTYNNLGNLPDMMSHLRLGHIIGSLGRVPKSILDVGYGNGSFLKACAKIIPHCGGHDISNYPVPEGCEFVDNMFEDNYDVVTFFDSLEHQDDPYFLNQLKCKNIVVSLPWCHYFSDDWFAGWRHRKPDEHLWHFDATSLVKFMKDQGYQLVSITNIEDTIRQHKEEYANILTGVFTRW